MMHFLVYTLDMFLCLLMNFKKGFNRYANYIHSFFFVYILHCPNILGFWRNCMLQSLHSYQAFWWFADFIFQQSIAPSAKLIVPKLNQMVCWPRYYCTWLTSQSFEQNPVEKLWGIVKGEDGKHLTQEYRWAESHYHSNQGSTTH